jgi:hypothetical protein
MKVIVHQHVAPGPYPEPLTLILEQGEELQPVRIVPINISALIPPRRDVVTAPGSINPQRSTHKRWTLSQSAGFGQWLFRKRKDVTPFPMAQAIEKIGSNSPKLSTTRKARLSQLLARE